MELSLTAGQRLGDLLALRWLAVHEDDMRFIQNKTQVDIVIERTTWLNDVLARCGELSEHSQP